MKPVTLNTIPHKSYTFKGGSTLIDGLYGDMIIAQDVGLVSTGQI